MRRPNKHNWFPIIIHTSFPNTKTNNIASRLLRFGYGILQLPLLVVLVLLRQIVIVVVVVVVVVVVEVHYGTTTTTATAAAAAVVTIPTTRTGWIIHPASSRCHTTSIRRKSWSSDHHLYYRHPRYLSTTATTTSSRMTTTKSRDSDSRNYIIQPSSLIRSRSTYNNKNDRCYRYRGRSPIVLDDTSSSPICFHPTTSSTIVIAGTLFVSSMVGLWIENLQQKQPLSLTVEDPKHAAAAAEVVVPSVGTKVKVRDRVPLPPSILATLGTATTIVYMIRKFLLYHHPGFSIPSNHYIYDYCWSTLLPSSLVLLLMSSSTSSSSSLVYSSSPVHVPANQSIYGENIDQPNNNNNSNNNNTKNYTPIESIQRLAMPFMIASIGSIIGCLFSFLISCFYYHSNKTKHAMFLNIHDASQAAACLCSSFIGGSINFFATANIITNMNRINNNNQQLNNSALLSAMSAVDIIVMAFYFSILTMAIQSPRLAQWFNSNKNDGVDPEQIQVSNEYDNKKFHNVIQVVDDGQDTTKPEAVIRANEPNTNDPIALSIPYVVPATIMVGSLALLLVKLSKRLEAWISRFVPGTACTFLAFLVPILTNQMNHQLGPSRTTRRLYLRKLWTSMQQCAEPMSRVALLTVFATMGCSMDLSTALFNGPACFVFSVIALLMHGIITLFGSLLWYRISKRYFVNNRHRIDLVDVLVASNAAIGGPATAAAFCNQIKIDATPVAYIQQQQQRKRHLITAATVWGVVGYAVGTSIGVTMYRILVHAFM